MVSYPPTIVRNLFTYQFEVIIPVKKPAMADESSCDHMSLDICSQCLLTCIWEPQLSAYRIWPYRGHATESHGTRVLAGSWFKVVITSRKSVLAELFYCLHINHYHLYCLLLLPLTCWKAKRWQVDHSLLGLLCHLINLSM